MPITFPTTWTFWNTVFQAAISTSCQSLDELSNLPIFMGRLSHCGKLIETAHPTIIDICPITLAVVVGLGSIVYFKKRQKSKSEGNFGVCRLTIDYYLSLLKQDGHTFKSSLTVCLQCLHIFVKGGCGRFMGI